MININNRENGLSGSQSRNVISESRGAPAEMDGGVSPGLLLPPASGVMVTIRVLMCGLKAICFRFDEILTLLLKYVINFARTRLDELH